MKITFVKRKYLWEYPFMMLQGIGSLLDGVVMLLSFGVCVSDFNLTFCKWRTTLWMKTLKKEKP